MALRIWTTSSLNKARLMPYGCQVGLRRWSNVVLGMSGHSIPGLGPSFPATGMPHRASFDAHVFSILVAPAHQTHRMHSAPAQGDYGRGLTHQPRYEATYGWYHQRLPESRPTFFFPSLQGDMLKWQHDPPGLSTCVAAQSSIRQTRYPVSSTVGPWRKGWIDNLEDNKPLRRPPW